MRLVRAVACAGLLVVSSLVATAASASAQTAATDTPTATPTPTTDAAAAASPTPTATVDPAAPTSTPTATVDPAAAATPTPTATVDPAAPTPTATVDPAAAVPTPTATPFVSGVPCATDDPHGPGGVRRSDIRGQDLNGEGDDDENATGNGRNEVILHNCTNNQLRVRASIQLNTIPGRIVKPLNEAYAEGSCVSCQTLSVALQVNLYSAERANDVEPENIALALNTNCTGCFTVARAIQYVQPVEDPQDVPDGVAQTVDRLDDELRSIQSDPDITLADAEARLNAVLVSFNQLGGSLAQQRDERHDDDGH
jgi:hypothetical protein